MPAWKITRFEKVATPATTLADTVPVSVPPPGLLAIVRVTMSELSVVTTLLVASSTSTVTGGVITDVDPTLQPPVYNGGVTRTQAISPGSPAQGAGRPTALGSCVDDSGAALTVDQRGAVRPYGTNCDLGAFEYGPMIFTDDFELEDTGRWSATVQ